MNLHMGHRLMDALSHTEGLQAMDIGVGFSKPMIRGLGFQRVVVTENGVKQEGQQWGSVLVWYALIILYVALL